jgi:hypothetical protein
MINTRGAIRNGVATHDTDDTALSRDDEWQQDSIEMSLDTEYQYQKDSYIVHSNRDKSDKYDIVFLRGFQVNVSRYKMGSSW